jgi:hypothetical protein
MDAGLVIMKPLDEVYLAIEKIGYFTVPTYHLLTENASINACHGCNVDPSFREGKMTLAGTFIGFKKEGPILEILKEALSIALIEEYIASMDSTHRHDQMIISLLLYKHMDQVLMFDGVVYCGWLSPGQTPGQKVWVHRREILPRDQAHFASYISNPGVPYVPVPPGSAGRFRVGWKKVLGTPERYIRKALRGELRKEDKPYDGIRDKS